jgi:hypothetical protein
VHATISEQLANVKQGLADCPESFSDNPQLRLIHECRAFSQELYRYAVGEKDGGQFVRNIRNIFRRFRTRLLKTIPSFDINSTADAEPKIVGVSIPEGPSKVSETGLDCLSTAEGHSDVIQTSSPGRIYFLFEVN